MRAFTRDRLRRPCRRAKTHPEPMRSSGPHHPGEHKGVIPPPPVGDEGIYTRVPNPEAGHEKVVIPPPGSWAETRASSRAKCLQRLRCLPLVHALQLIAGGPLAA